MKYLPKSDFEGEANEALLPFQAHVMICLIARGFISKVNSWRLIRASTIFQTKIVVMLTNAKKTDNRKVLIFIFELSSEVKSDCHEILSGALVYGDF